MTTINDISDVARVLREHPEWRETIRGLVLGEETARLPEQLASFVEASQRNFEATDRRIAALDRRLAALDRRLASYIEATQRNFEATDRRIATLDTRLDTFIEATQQNFEDLSRRLDAFIEATQRNFELVYQRLDRLEQDQDVLKTGMNRLTGRVDNGLGAYYEIKAEKAARRLADQYLDLLRVRVLQGAPTGADRELADRLDDARITGALNQYQFQEILKLDLVLAGKRSFDGADLYVAAEVSITAGDSDILRAARRAALLADFTGNRVLPAVVSAHVDDDRKTLAAQKNVTVMMLPEV